MQTPNTQSYEVQCSTDPGVPQRDLAAARKQIIKFRNNLEFCNNLVSSEAMS